MRKAMFLLAVFGLVSLAWAADPSEGTWKLNIAKSKFAPSVEAPMKEETIVKRALDADLFEVIVKGTRTDGSTFSEKITHPQKGGVQKTQPAPAAGEFYVVTVIGPGNFYITHIQNEKQVQVEQWVIDKDGKTGHNTIKGIDAKGKPYEEVGVWEKQ